jgi:hypothetical protein
MKMPDDFLNKTTNVAEDGQVQKVYVSIVST